MNRLRIIGVGIALTFSIPAMAADTELQVPIPAASVAPVTAPPSQQWQLSIADGTLRAALGKWAKQAGWQLSWEASVDLTIPVAASFEGDFPTAVKALFSALSASEVSLAALLYGGNQVLRVTESGHRSK